MKIKVCAIRDQQLDAYGQPIFAASIGHAIRSFGDAINSPESNMHKHAGDYNLYELAEYDDNTGRFENLELPKQIAIGKNMKEA